MGKHAAEAGNSWVHFREAELDKIGSQTRTLPSFLVGRTMEIVRFGYHTRQDLNFRAKTVPPLEMRTSLTIFRDYLVHTDMGEVDASRIHSRECYLAWLEHRRQEESPKEAKRFQRTLSNHLTGVDGRTPFAPEEEAAILLVVRKKERWPCFPRELSIGCTGFRSLGHHEKFATNQFKQRIEGLDGKKFQDREFAMNFANEACDYAEALDTYDLDGYVRLGNLLRYVMFARTPACLTPQPATEETAWELCSKFTVENPDCVVVIMSLAAYDYTDDFVLAQNDLAYRVMGDLNERQRTELPFPVGNVFKVLFAMCTALLSPGIEVPVLGVRFNSLAPHQIFDGAYLVDPASYLLVQCVKPAPGIPFFG